MNMRQLRYVLVLAEKKSFSRAAAALNISQPSLSQYIKKIEKEVGLELFDRMNGDVRLTDAGRVYIEGGRKILDIEHQMEVGFSDISLYKTGSLIIGAAPYRTATMLPVIAAEFHKKYPGMHLVVREGTTDELSDGMEHGEYDLCLTMLPVNDTLFSYENVIEEELVLAVPSSVPGFPSEIVPGRKYPAIDATLLDGQPFVMLTELQYMQKQLKDILLANRISVKTAVVVKSIDAQIAMVKEGLGLALVPYGAERSCMGSDVRFYSFIQPLPKREVVVMWLKDRKLSETAKELKQIIKNIAW